MTRPTHVSTDSELRGADARAREAAQTVFDRPLVLTAGAGTGKTSALVARIVVWCTGPGWERVPAGEDTARRVLQRVVAITFTEAAAAEMAERVSRAFAQLEAGEVPQGVLASALPEPDLLRPRARALLESLDQLVVRTIHAWCRKLLAANPLEAGVHPAFEIDADESARAEVVREVLERALREEWADGSDAGFAALARAGVGPDILEQELLRALAAGMPAEALERDPFDPERVSGFRESLSRAVAAFDEFDRGRLATARNVRRGVEVEEALGITRRGLEALDGPDALASFTAELRLAWKETRLKTLGDWSKRPLRKGELEALGPDADGLAPIAATLRGQLRSAIELDPERLQTVRRALAPLLQRILDELHRRGSVSYDALLRDTARLLSKPAAAARVRASLAQLLVDEFQDTDHTQCEVLRAIALPADREGVPGLFLVGDPKQSIYGWRSADLAAYEGFLREVDQAGGERHELALNFRSRPSILDEVERVMSTAMRYERDIQPEFARLVPTVDERPGPAVEYWVSWGRHGPVRASESSAIEAGAVARDLCRLRDAGVELGNVALLFRTRSDFDVYLAALRAADVPYSVEGDRSFYRRREIIEASALVRAIADPHDTLSLLTWLRSASVGVPDAALLPLWREGLPALAAELPEGDPDAVVERAAAATPRDVPGLDRVPGWPHALRDALRALGELRRSFATNAPDVFVENLRARTLLEATESARFLGAYRLANLDRFFRELVARLESGQRDPQAVLRGLRASVRIGQEEEEGRSLAPGPNAVNVLTIHKAKGLDFEHVYLLQAQKEPVGSGAEPFGTEFDGHWEYRLADAPTLGYARALEHEHLVVEAERVRTLYVATTRAKHRLVVAGAWPGRPAPTSHLAILARREGGVPDLTRLAAQLAEAGAASMEHEGVRWVFPALVADADPDVRPQPPSGRRARRARADAERLREASVRARSHMQRPLRGAASAANQNEAHMGGGSGVSREVARRAGTEVHRVLEELDLGADPGLELALQRERALRRLAAEPDVAAATAELIDAMEHGTLLARLRELAPAIVARELAVLLPPEDGEGPTGCIEGVADLVYVDPESGDWVVADYKTDAELEAGAYRKQLAVYARALRDGLGLPCDPRMELWMLRADRVVKLGGDAVHSRPS